MSIERVRQLITLKGNIRLEFKVGATALPGNLFETICAMLNRDSGNIILCVDDKNTLLGLGKSVNCHIERFAGANAPQSIGG